MLTELEKREAEETCERLKEVVEESALEAKPLLYAIVACGAMMAKVSGAPRQAVLDEATKAINNIFDMKDSDDPSN